ncbi:MAG: type II toxin-antitoxin system ParD family antitoxin [Comamonadaceae bacterium CG_4_9_14_3_um_filter_60_33]|nr:MAG: CopG family transcriptional regulator [Comamonadaceae bacterium CG2_30_59_20]PIY28635.1 MAG: type II toxin-antitoxin system ParD family antitoxin [Comamonadaceae bacterium CG_4_10_14_3_um_filter_60_42]PJB45939.1 MAG: type II toxin-antitoxin system ParD family antitoxin [Comamonadaceae bacterium CG_4_9_14_3_um_filter_60_33]
MPTRNVVITEHQSQLIDQWVAAGDYQNASEVLREGLRLVEQNKLDFQARLQALREAVNVGLADIEAGRFQTFDSGEALAAHYEALLTEVLDTSA